jgi:hypothetical protein
MNKKALAGLYWFIVIAFSTLEPWGNIDTRNFSYMGPYKFWEYNAYIIFQMVAMVVLGILLWRRKAGMKSLLWIAAINSLFISMNLFDLLHLFPDPAQPLPFLVSLIEVVTSVVALCILLLAPRAINAPS